PRSFARPASLFSSWLFLVNFAQQSPYSPSWRVNQVGRSADCRAATGARPNRASSGRDARARIRYHAAERRHDDLLAWLDGESEVEVLDEDAEAVDKGIG